LRVSQGKDVDFGFLAKFSGEIGKCWDAPVELVFLEARYEYGNAQEVGFLEPFRSAYYVRRAMQGPMQPCVG
jgi:hypothetical protein